MDYGDEDEIEDREEDEGECDEVYIEVSDVERKVDDEYREEEVEKG